MKDLKRSLRRWQAETHMWRRLKEDRNQHRGDTDHRHLVATNNCGWQTGINWLEQRQEQFPDEEWHIALSHICPCFTDPKAMARFKEQPQDKTSSRLNGDRKWHGPTIQERRHAN